MEPKKKIVSILQVHLSVYEMRLSTGALICRCDRSNDRVHMHTIQLFELQVRSSIYRM